ncbi:MAG TPA: hypothetical protein VEA16_07710, partial [Vicinamibacterales bacterium]|nr:hypothetical protein [Vicinamibacterales bacterium]
PTVLALLGQRVPDLDLPFGAPLYVAADREPRPRRRQSVLLMSSYGSSYALLRRNGKLLYISDLISWRDYSYTLFAEPLGTRVPVTESARRIGQAGIREHWKKLEEIYRR